MSLKDSPNVSLMSVFFAVYAPHLRNLPSTGAGNAECLYAVAQLLVQLRK